MSNFKKLMMTAAGGEALNVEDVFSTYVYDGNSSNRSITNNIDLSTEGGLVWIKGRTSTTYDFNNTLFDTERGAGYRIHTDLTSAQGYNNNSLTSFNTDGFSLGTDGSLLVNWSSNDYVSWTFRKAPKFFDVVTYTGNGTTQTISHNLDAVPGCIIVKRTDTTENWTVYNNASANAVAPEDRYMYLNTTDAQGTRTDMWNSTAPTSTSFQVGSSETNASGGTYVAYLFAHNDGDGGFGPDGDADIIKCGSYTTDSGSQATVDLGFEPSWVMYKKTNSTGQWYIEDTMRGLFAPTQAGNTLIANLSNAEGAANGAIHINSSGFETKAAPNNLGASNTFIYIAIRRGPMATPESASEVFGLNAYTGNNASERLITSSGTGVTDMAFINRALGGSGSRLATRLGGYPYVVRDDFNAEVNSNTRFKSFDDNNGFYIGSSDQVNSVQSTYVAAMWSRAPKYFDVVEYSGTGSTGVKDHNLGVVPEMMWLKNRRDTDPWGVYHKDVGATKYIPLHTNSTPLTTSLAFGNTAPTATQFTVGSTFNFNSSQRYSVMLFASVSGVSKVGSYTGNGTNQTIDCGFSSGASYVLIKRTDAVGNWVESNSEYGIVAANETAFLVDTGAKTSSHDFIDPANSGFIVNQDTVTNINVNNATYIFYAIAAI